MESIAVPRGATGRREIRGMGRRAVPPPRCQRTRWRGGIAGLASERKLRAWIQPVLGTRGPADAASKQTRLTVNAGASRGGDPRHPARCCMLPRSRCSRGRGAPSSRDTGEQAPAREGPLVRPEHAAILRDCCRAKPASRHAHRPLAGRRYAARRAHAAAERMEKISSRGHLPLGPSPCEIKRVLLLTPLPRA